MKVCSTTTVASSIMEEASLKCFHSDRQQDHHSGSTAAAFGVVHQKKKKKPRKNFQPLAVEQTGRLRKILNLPMTSQLLLTTYTQKVFFRLRSPHSHKHCLRFPPVGPADWLMSKKTGKTLHKGWS